MTPPVPTSVLRRRPDTHKGDYGHVVVVGGSIGLTGAPALSALAALRSGAGLVSLGVPESVYFILAAKLTEVMVHPLPETSQGTLNAAAHAALRPLLSKADCLAVGPGISQNAATQALVRKLVTASDVPVVLDADGIAAFAGEYRISLRKAKAPVVITPHPGEMGQLLGVSIKKVQSRRQLIARDVARKLKVFVILKGHRTVVAAPSGKTYVNTTGNPGMATAGMGDVLTGIIAAFLGQGCDPFTSAVAAVYLHGLAGDIAAAKVGQVSLMAGDVLATLPDAFKKIS